MKAYQVDRERWGRFTLFDQMGNIGIEVSRTIRAGMRHDSEGLKQGIIRSLDLFEATTKPLLSQKSPRAKEVLRAKEQFLQIVSDGTFDSAQATSLDRYFLLYAIAARSQR